MIKAFISRFNKIRFRTFRALINYNLKKTKLPVGQIVNIELTNRCNQKCSFCPVHNPSVKKPVSREKKDIPISDFEKLIKQYRGHIKTLSICHHGESFLHPEFNKAIKILKKHNVPYSITTNGFLVGKHIASLERYPPKSIMFSLYTVNRNKFKKLTKTGNLDIVLENIEKVLAVKKTKKINTKIIIRVIRMKGFEKDIQEVEEYFKNKDVDLNINVLNSWAGRVDVSKFGEVHSNVVDFKYCSQPWTHCIIGSDLGVYICNNHEDEPIGYLTESNLEKIWNSKKYQKIRENILKGKFRNNEICSKCDYFMGGCVVNKPTIFFFLDRFFWKTFFSGIGLFKIKDQSKLLSESKKTKFK